MEHSCYSGKKKVFQILGMLILAVLTAITYGLMESFSGHAFRPVPPGYLEITKPYLTSSAERTDVHSNMSKEALLMETVLPKAFTASYIIENLQTYHVPSKQEVDKSMTIHNGFDIQPKLYRNDFRSPCWVRKKWNSSTPIIRCLPKAYLLGFTKCATTDLWRRLQRHPHIRGGIKELRGGNVKMAKEIHWWSKSRFKGHTIGRNYAKYFGDAIANDPFKVKRRITLVDASPDTIWEMRFKASHNEETSPPRILTPSLVQRFTPNAKFIVIMRNPVDRLYSHYDYNKLVGDETPSALEFHIKVTQAVGLLTDCFRRRTIRDCVYDPFYRKELEESKVFLHVGLYVVYLNDWFKIIPKNQFYLTTSEKYGTDLKGVLENITEFLQVDAGLRTAGERNATIADMIRDSGKKVNRMIYNSPMWNATRSLLLDFYHPFNEALSTLLGNKKYLWPEDRG